MDLTLLRTFLAVAERGAVGEAADFLGVSQPALTRRMHQFEAQVGAQLVARRGRGIALTDMGRLVAREGLAIVERYDRLLEDVARHTRLETGLVRVGGGATAVSYLLPRAILRFQKAYPGLRLEVREAGSRDIEQAVRSEALELGLVTLPLAGTDLVIRPLLTDRIVLVAGREHLLSSKKRVSLRQLEGQSLVGFEAGTAIRNRIDGALRDAGVTMNVVMELRSIAAILRMVEMTGSLAFVSEMGAPKARIVPVAGLRVERQLALISKAGRTLSPGAAAFAEQVIQVVRDGERGARC